MAGKLSATTGPMNIGAVSRMMTMVSHQGMLIFIVRPTGLVAFCGLSLPSPVVTGPHRT